MEKIMTERGRTIVLGLIAEWRDNILAGYVSYDTPEKNEQTLAELDGAAAVILRLPVEPTR